MQKMRTGTHDALSVRYPNGDYRSIRRNENDATMKSDSALKPPKKEE